VIMLASLIVFLIMAAAGWIAAGWFLTLISQGDGERK